MILLADDNPNDVELTIIGFEEDHLANEVAIARDGVEALDYLYRRGKFADREKGNPLVVLLDLKMPKVDGFEVLRQMRSDPNLKLIPVIVLTSSREEQDIIESYNLGINAYVVKPVVFDKLVEVVKQIGLFWLLTNESPPGSVARPNRY